MAMPKRIGKKGLRKSFVPEKNLCCMISSDTFERVQKDETDSVAMMTDSTLKTNGNPEVKSNRIGNIG